jgi:hypothetical protein
MSILSEKQLIGKPPARKTTLAVSAAKKGYLFGGDDIN